MFSTSLRYCKITNCATCDDYNREIFKYRSHTKGTFIPEERTKKHTIFFIIEGLVEVKSEEYPNVILHKGDFILQPNGSKASFRMLENSACIMYMFDQPLKVCKERYEKGLAITAQIEPQSIVLEACSPLLHFLEGIRLYLNEDMRCSSLMKAKRTELVHLICSYYTLKDLAIFYSTLYQYSNSFKYFVLHNYKKAKDVEEFAHMSGYSLQTFRRLFKETFKESPYQWMLSKKSIDIMTDLIETNLPITEICKRYNFESLSNFSHFCSTNFGNSPRDIRDIYKGNKNWMQEWEAVKVQKKKKKQE